MFVKGRIYQRDVKEKNPVKQEIFLLSSHSRSFCPGRRFTIKKGLVVLNHSYKKTKQTKSLWKVQKDPVPQLQASKRPLFAKLKIIFLTKMTFFTGTFKKLFNVVWTGLFQSCRCMSVIFQTNNKLARASQRTSRNRGAWTVRYYGAYWLPNWNQIIKSWQRESSPCWNCTIRRRLKTQVSLQSSVTVFHKKIFSLWELFTVSYLIVDCTWCPYSYFSTALTSYVERKFGLWRSALELSLTTE